MPDETQTPESAPAEKLPVDAPAESAAPGAPPQDAAYPAPEHDAEADHENDAEQAEVETVMCMVSKKMVPLDETVEIERKKGEVLRLHQRYKKFD